MATVQMNVRIDGGFKAEGDAAFRSIGYSPTDAVRELWGFAQRNRGNLGALADLMRSLRDPADVRAEQDARDEEMARFEEWLSQGPAIVDGFCTSVGVARSAIGPVGPGDYDDILADALDEDIERIVSRP